jgi:tripartite-type tricarboxylate transporter receptor subunit TctC
MRRQILHLAAGAAALPIISRIAWAQAYPTKPVQFVVPFAPAGTTDLLARLMGQWLSERLGHQFIIENRPGAGHHTSPNPGAQPPTQVFRHTTFSPALTDHQSRFPVTSLR